MRYKHVRLDRVKLEKAKKILKVKTDTDAIDRALTLVTCEAEINDALWRVKAKGRLKKLFR